MKNAEFAVARVIERINCDYHEELSIDDLADTAFYSKFHFTRVFQRVTGVTPGRYLSAVRLQKAKELLLSTELTVTEISHGVGYASGGTFSSRFARSVGVPPSVYRALGGYRPAEESSGAVEVAGGCATEGDCSVIHGRIDVGDYQPTGPIFVGAFPGPIHQGRPVRSVLLAQPGHFTLEGVPPQDWYVMACCVGTKADASPQSPVDPLLVGSQGPLRLRAGVPAVAELGLHPPRMLEPPVLLALPFRSAA